MAEPRETSVRDVLLARRGVAVLPPGAGSSSDDVVRALELELAGIGYVVAARLRDRMSQSSPAQLAEFRSWATAALLAHLGGHVKHEPLFRKFPEGIPADTAALWWQKVLVHFMQADDQPCLFCRRTGTTHVLNPCRHVVCDVCFDGANYSGCPVCEQRVDRSSPFFLSSPELGVPKERVTFKLLDLGGAAEDESRALFLSLCERTQALSPDDRQALVAIVRESSVDILAWLPDKIPVRENIAVVFGTLLTQLDAAHVLPFGQRFLTTATDVLRLIAVMSGTDGALIPEAVVKRVRRQAPARQFWQQMAKLMGARPPELAQQTIFIPIKVRRFKVARMPRALRRALLQLLESLEADRLIEDMLRHQSFWVWVGEFLHPHEYAARFPNVARAFQIVRKHAPDGTPAPKFHTWYARLEQALTQRDVSNLLAILCERPGEFARRIDLALRLAGRDPEQIASVVREVARQVTHLATPVLVTLSALLPTRIERAKVRVYWPKGRIALSPSAADYREPLPQQAVSELVRLIRTELLRRFAEKPHFDGAIVDARLRSVTAPFNERTASASAVALARGSRIPVELSKHVRLFLHWCEPTRDGYTDLDLSVALYDDQWRYLGVCSYYQLQLVNASNAVVARSSGDLRSAPPPDGATEFVDIDCTLAAGMSVRYAVMVVNAYAGLPFNQLERAFAGLMLRDDPAGQHFDPCTVKLRFALDGANGIFTPLVLDLEQGLLHWLDVQSKGELEMNNVETSRAAIARICPDLIKYFGSGVRPSLFHLALLHAAARCQRVSVRSDEGGGNNDVAARTKQYARRPGETALEFFDRINADSPPDAPPANSLPPALTGNQAVFAALFQGNVELPAGSCVYALFREQTAPTIAASDLLS